MKNTVGVFAAAGVVIGAAMGGRVFAEAEIRTSAAVQLTKESPSVSDENLDGAFVRCETRFSAQQAEAASGLVHLRLQSDMGEKYVKLYIRQGYFDVPLWMTTLRGGRWYEVYTPGEYFGRYLFGVKKIEEDITPGDGQENPVTIGYGSGSMKTDYTVVDGLRLEVPFPEGVPVAVEVGFLPSSPVLDDAWTMALLRATPLEKLDIKLGTTIHTLTSNGDDRVHRLSTSFAWHPWESGGAFAEYGIVDLSDVGEHSWILAGIDIPSGGILDMLRLEIEYANDRMSTTDEADPGWMVVVGRKVAGLAFNLDVGADPLGLRSRSAGDVGGYLRTTFKF